jgi:diaminohydroxyphosphoribosylaminopyrimidine deaminase/5-amino-6-(5-phosphoribosylamino)uracil reductase
VIIEGGSNVLSSFIRRRLWQKMIVFIAPMIVGGAEAPSIFGGDGVAKLMDAYRFRFEGVEVVGEDLLITAYPITAYPITAYPITAYPSLSVI